MTSIATITLNPALDVSASTERVVVDAKLRLDGPTREPGGGGLNVSRVIARLGGSSTAIYTCGGSMGEELAGLLTTAVGEGGVRVAPVPIAGRTRDNLSVTDRATGEQYRFVMPGPELSEDEWRRCLDAVDALHPAPGYVVASGSLPPGVPGDVLAQLAVRCRDRGSRLIVDTSGPALGRALEEGVFLVKPNAGELARLLGRDLGDPADYEAAARTIVREGGSEAVLLSLGAGGAFLATRHHDEHVRSPTVPIVSKVGAGDSMVGALVLALARDEPLPRAARFGVAAGAAAVMTAGSELCRREDTERLFTWIEQA